MTATDREPRRPDFEPALCRQVDLDAFNADWSSSNAHLRRLCSMCPVLDECREWAVWFEPSGFWGGLSSRQREQERKARDIQIKPGGDWHRDYAKEEQVDGK